MVKLDVVRSANSALVQSQPLVAVFFGGTGGIGSYTLRALATAEAQNGGKGVRAYVVGRKAESAERILSECRDICPEGQFKFVQAGDLSLIQVVDQVCAEILELEEKEGQDARIDYLMLSQGGSIFLPRKETKEGIDVTMSLMYYSRMRIIMRLLPLLLKSNLPPRVVSVYAAGMEAKLFPEDLSLRDLKHFSYSQARSHMVYMHTLFMEALAEQNASKVGLVHIFPGLVLGPAFSSPELPAWFRFMWRFVFVPLFGRFVTVPTEESGARMLSLASPRYAPQAATDGDIKKSEELATGTNGTPGSGVYALDSQCESSIKTKAYEKFNKDEMRKKVYDHTISAFEVAAQGGVFTE
ncbi:uncharacterized protein TRUGW13939_00196 [Talaromyces rugulosus]|uniref:Ketoreductase (KR) domain-containing protein n=1 Tax=Talaromyces rugulosus TaxID=121627 RepID=A0A7H8QHS5_TALRU|nr:uncharacterized protein TRUGW13939_00196 [Talaromyces rugulosus]QKX53122.1 hypothetical protein TRUGW13939_00196 [Talaromyces rugulosus]